ncbi:hypothetical protein [Lewinella sp. IMCC34191]|uniref:hypothetical protein n=1 Tax=Lewinella sp. IMCC34191 TaxID=2259172 RepID=UPI000E21DD50|nr:hypothetical protein [Lewinella sp. IMCC34191]
MSSRYRRWLFALIPVLVLADTAYSFLQYYHHPLDGDVAWNLVPASEVLSVLADPFGVSTWLEGQIYPNPNRFFCHWSFRAYFLHFPVWLQHFTDPVSSVYLAAAMARIGTQLLLVALFVRVVTGHWKLSSRGWWVTALLFIPFFQANGYRSHIGIVDPSVTYTFFYALPAALLLLFLLPFIDRYGHGRQSLPAWQIALWIPLAAVVCLSGPLNPATIGVACATAGWYVLRHRPGWADIRADRSYLLLALWAAALSGYALWIGSFNSLTIDNAISLDERYARLPLGIFRQFTGKLAWPVLLAGLAINYGFLRRSAGNKQLLRWYRYGLVFASLYILLLPLGGYREYRPYILRYDTILPITLLCLIGYVAGVRAVYRSMQPARRSLYLLLPITIALVYTFADEPSFEQNNCEVAALRHLAAETSDTIVLNTDCPVLAWQTFAVPEESELNARLLRAWRIVDRDLRYYHLIYPSAE